MFFFVFFGVCFVFYGFLQVFGFLHEGLSQDLQNNIFFMSFLVFCRVFEDCYFFCVLSVLSMAFSQDPKFVFASHPGLVSGKKPSPPFLLKSLLFLYLSTEISTFLFSFLSYFSLLFSIEFPTYSLLVY